MSTPDGALLDTSVLIAGESGRQLDLSAVPAETFISVITLAELEVGIHAAADAQIRARRLQTFSAVARYGALPIDASAASHWARLRFRLHEADRRANVNDLWIAAIALARNMPVVTQDADFDVLSDLDGPSVIRV